MRRLLLLAAFAMAAFASQAQAQVVAGDTIVYDNNASGFTGTGVTTGASGTAAQGTVTFTQMFSDDITTAAGSGGQSILGSKFAVLYTGATAVSVRPRIRFFQNDNGGTAPGTNITGFSFNPITFQPNTITTVSFTLTAGQLVIPANGQFWAGLL